MNPQLTLYEVKNSLIEIHIFSRLCEDIEEMKFLFMTLNHLRVVARFLESGVKLQLDRYGSCYVGFR